MASPTVTDVTTTIQDSANLNLTVNYPATVDADDLLICVLSVDGNRTLTWPGTWTSFFDLAEGSSNKLAFGWRKADGTEDGGTFNVASSSAETHTALVYRIPDAEDPTTQPPEASTGATSGGTGTNPDPDTVTPTGGANDYLWIAAQGNDRDRTTTAFPSGFTNTQTVSGGGANSTGVGAAQLTSNAASQNPGTFTISSADGWVAATIAVHPPASGGTTVNTNLDALTLTENTATVNAETNVQANVDTLTLTENAATISLQVDIQTNVDVLTLSTFSATVNAETNVNAGVDSLTLTTFQATVSLGVVVSTNVDALALTEFAAGVNAAANVVADSTALSLATFAATVSVGGAGHPVVKITRLALDGYGVRTAGSFAGKAPAGAGPHNPGKITRLSLDGYGARRAIFLAKGAAGAGPHNPGTITRLSLDGYGARRAGSFAGKAPASGAIVRQIMRQHSIAGKMDIGI